MNKPSLKRSLNFPLLTLYGLGTILGAGIYVLVGKVAGTAGIYAPVAFLVSAILAGFTGYSYAQLSIKLPFSAGEALYIDQAFSNHYLSAAIGWLVVLTGTVSAATIANGFVGYLSTFISVPDTLACTLIILLITSLACWGITESVTIAAIITGLEILGLFIVLWVLGDELTKLPDIWREYIPPVEKDIWVTIFLGAFLAFYAFIGFEDMVNITEEVKNPEVTMPRAIFAALFISSTLYILISLVAVISLPLDQLRESGSPMVSLLEHKSAQAAIVIAVISIIAVVNGALVQIIMGARVMYGMGNRSMAPKWFSKIHAKTRTPVNATVVVALAVWLLAIAFPLVTLAKMTSFIIIVVFALVNFSLVVIEWRKSYKFFNWLKIGIPLTGTLFCVGFLILQTISVLSGKVIAQH